MAKAISLTLEIINGVYDGLSYNMGPSATSLSIGRAPDNEVSIPFESMASRSHAQIVKEGDSFYLIDQKSMNGSFLNESKVVDRINIYSDDIVRIGNTKFRCILKQIDA